MIQNYYRKGYAIVCLYPERNGIESILERIQADCINIFRDSERWDDIELYAIQKTFRVIEDTAIEEFHQTTFMKPTFPYEGLGEEDYETSDTQLMQNERYKNILEWLRQSMLSTMLSSTAQSANPTLQVSSRTIIDCFGKHSTAKIGKKPNYYQIETGVGVCQYPSGNDHYYVQQRGIWSASNRAASSGLFKPGTTVESYNINTYPLNYKGDRAAVWIHDYSPSTDIQTNTITRSFDWSLSGSFPLGIIAGLSGGSSNSITSNTTTVNAKVASDVNNAEWEYEITKGTLMSRGAFKPVNEWDWEAVPATRQSAILTIAQKRLSPMINDGDKKNVGQSDLRW